MKRDKYQRRAYACRRMSLAVDRSIRAANPAEKAQAKRWAEAWAKAGGIRRCV
jgi:hypothetical protein